MHSSNGYVYLSRADVKALLAHASKDEARLHLSAVCFEPADATGKSHVVATDGHRLAVSVIAPTGFNLLLSRADLEKHGKRASAKQFLAVDGSSIGIAEEEEGAVTGQLPIKPVDGHFPPWREVVPGKLQAGKRAPMLGVNAAYMADLALVALACGKKTPMVAIQPPEGELDPIRFDVEGVFGQWFGAIMPCRI